MSYKNVIPGHLRRKCDHLPREGSGEGKAFNSLFLSYISFILCPRKRFKKWQCLSLASKEEWELA